MALGTTLAHLFHPRRSNNHRPRLLHPEVLLILCMLMVGVFTTMNAIERMPGRLGSVLGFASSITPSQVIQETNEQRTKVGLPVLTANAQLSAAALAKGQDMFLKQYWAHTAPDGTTPWKFFRDAGYGYQVAGENLARDFSDTTSMTAAWMASPTHRANIMNAKYQEIGIAVIDGNLQGVDTTLVVQMFGAPRGAAVADIGQQAVVAPRQGETTVPAFVQTSLEEIAQPHSLVLASTLVENGELRLPPLFTPLQILKAIFLALVIMLTLTLTYDSFVIGHRSTMRLVGHNLAHVILFAVVAFLLISFRGGVLG